MGLMYRHSISYRRLCKCTICSLYKSHNWLSADLNPWVVMPTTVSSTRDFGATVEWEAPFLVIERNVTTAHSFFFSVFVFCLLLGLSTFPPVASSCRQEFKGIKYQRICLILRSLIRHSFFCPSWTDLISILSEGKVSQVSFPL